MKISIVIPTYNRSEDLRITLSALNSNLHLIKEVIIVDQSKNDETKNLIKSLKNSKIKYIFSKIPSITIARNIGAKNASKESDIICFIDDDVTLKKEYFKEILKVFKEHPESKAVAGYCQSEYYNPLENFSKGIFLLGNLENKERARIVSAYGNTYPRKLKRVVNSQWIPGVNMCYRKEVLKEQKFDENLLGYTVAEDIDFSYRLYKKYPSSLVITPFAKLSHRASTVERTPTEKMAYINQIDHFYFFFKNLNGGYLDKIKFTWSLFGIGLLRTLNLLIKPGKISFLKWRYFLKSLYYCLTNLNKIKEGKVRDFLKSVH